MITAKKKNTINQATTMLATSKNIPFPGHNHMLTTGTDDLTLWLSLERQRVAFLLSGFAPGNGNIVQIATTHHHCLQSQTFPNQETDKKCNTNVLISSMRIQSI